MPLPISAPEITPEELVEHVDAGRAIHVLDVRAPARLATGRIDVVQADRFHNIMASKLIALQTPGAIGLPTDTPVAIVCARGNDSRVIAHHLNQLGYDAKSLRGGMERWMQTLVPRDLEPPPSLDRLVQFDRPGKGALGYLLISAGEALVVDPPRQAKPYLDAVRAAGARLVAVADTHVHADYISGAPALARSLGVPYHLHPADNVYPYDGTPGRLELAPLADGATIRVGRAAVRVAHTPGHTEGSVTYMVDDAVALTGDFVFVISIGRPDLAGKTEEWTAALWRSIERARREWPPDLMILPAHYTSQRERQANRTIGRRFGDLLRANEPLAIGTEEAFARWVASKASGFPEVYRQIKAINVGLATADDGEADVLEMGKSVCALG